MGVQLNVENGGHCVLMGVPVCWRFTLISFHSYILKDPPFSGNPQPEQGTNQSLFARTRRAHGAGNGEVRTEVPIKSLQRIAMRGYTI